MTDSFTRPTDSTRSYQLVWKKNIPKVLPSNWAPGYTEAHQPTVEDAVKYGMHKLVGELSDMRSKYLMLTALLGELQMTAEGEQAVEVTPGHPEAHAGPSGERLI